MLFTNSIINDETEQLDINWLVENATEKYPIGKDYQYYYREKGNTYVIYISGNSRNGYHAIRFDNHSCLALVKSYYPNGYIKEKGSIFNTLSEISGFRNGIWYFFNEYGMLSDSKDYDEHFQFSAEDVFRYCEEHRIKLEKGIKPYLGGGFFTNIKKLYPETSGTCEWVIIRSAGGKHLEEIRLDGKTGHEMGKRDLELVDD